MLDIKFIRENTALVKQAIQNRRLSLDIGKFIELDEKRREILLKLDDLRAQKNRANDEISSILKANGDPKEKIASMKDIAGRIDGQEAELKGLEPEILNLLQAIPNIPHSSVPVGDVSVNKVVRSWGEPRKLAQARTHIELAEHLDIIDFSRAAKITASNFILYKGYGARMERALYNFMLDLHTSEHGYKEIFPPFLVNRASMIGTGQLPKMEGDMYRLKDEDLFLIPTAEVPVTNMFRDETLQDEDLPIYYTAYTACFRKEAGSYGKDTRGLMRVHQFDKVELVKFVRPQDSYDELEKLVGNAEKVLQLLGLPYRVVMLSTADISFAASKCYDLEVYASGIDKWLEVSSCSNFESFQARRANIKFKRTTEDRRRVTEYVHTLNGSGVALARTMVAILENYQQADGTVLIPEVLRPYMGGIDRIGI